MPTMHPTPRTVHPTHPMRPATLRAVYAAACTPLPSNRASLRALCTLLCTTHPMHRAPSGAASGALRASRVGWL